MEELPGVREISRAPEDDRRARTLIAQLHRAGFSHRDLKPSNIVINSLGQVFLIDLEGLRFEGEVTPQRAVADLKRYERD